MSAGSTVADGVVKPIGRSADFHRLLGARWEIEDVQPARHFLLLFKIAAARNRERSRGEARARRFGLTTPLKGSDIRYGRRYSAWRGVL